MKRYLENSIREDLKQKMVFLGGPRQVGKTTLAKSILPAGAYLNFDIPQDREKILKRQLPPTKLVCFDEIHKYRSWRNYMKGLYDEYQGKKNFLVTGSARLDFYRFGGDSLQGRYFYLRLHPLSLAELNSSKKETLESLLKLGPFPEPFLSGSDRFSKRWRQDYRARLLQEEISSLENISDLGKMELLLLQLPQIVGSTLSINSLREDLQTSHATMSRWLDILERTYAFFRLRPFGYKLLRAVQKETKAYFFDWAVVDDASARLENLVAAALLKWVHYDRDTEGNNTELCFFRDRDGREVDFVVVRDKKPIQFVEVKTKSREISNSLKYLKSKFKEAEAHQISLDPADYEKDGIRVWPVWKYLATLV